MIPDGITLPSSVSVILRAMGNQQNVGDKHQGPTSSRKHSGGSIDLKCCGRNGHCRWWILYATAWQVRPWYHLNPKSWRLVFSNLCQKVRDYTIYAKDDTTDQKHRKWSPDPDNLDDVSPKNHCTDVQRQSPQLVTYIVLLFLHTRSPCFINAEEGENFWIPRRSSGLT